MPRFYRYLSNNGDGVAARTLPGVHPKGAYFTRGSGHNKFGGYTEDADEYQEVMDRLARKHAAAARVVPAPEIIRQRGRRSRRHHPGRLPGRGARRRWTGCASAAWRSITAHPGVPVRPGRARLPGDARVLLRGRAEPRRAAAVAAACSRPAWRATAPFGARLRRIPARHQPGDRRHRERTRNAGVRACRRSPNRGSITRRCKQNALGLTLRDYEGSMSTLCAGCGHDSITAAIIRAFWELEIPPHRVAKLSGIGCSSKTPAYFVAQAHGFNSAHGRMPAIATGANAANRDLYYIGISGDGDSLSIGLGQMCHAIRRNVRMVYVLENNGVYGLTKGQFSASADIGSKSKRGEPNMQAPIDPVLLGADARRDLRRAQLLGRQGAAGPDPQGGASRTRLRAGGRDLAVRDLQRSRGVDQELPVHAPALPRGGSGGLRADPARDLGDPWLTAIPAW